jgi:hypothetical protein
MTSQGNPGFLPGFRVALAVARLPGMTGCHEHSTEENATITCLL